MSSIFNTVVKFHLATPLLLRAINWAQKDDPNKTYPLLGRLRYVWLSEDYQNVKLLLKDGPQSWTDPKDREALMAQIKSHETFVSVEVYEEDPCYIIATFRPVLYIPGYEREFTIDELFEHIKELDQLMEDPRATVAFGKRGAAKITKDPFEIFHEALEGMKGGDFPPDVKKLAETMANVIKSKEAEDKMAEDLKASGIDGFEPAKFIALAVDGSGTVQDVTDKFMEDQKKEEE